MFLVAALVALSPAPAYADAVRVVYRVEATAGSWQPISPRDLTSAIEHAALEVLSKPGLMRLERARGRGTEQAQGAYELTIAGNLLDEAETHTVYLSFGPGTESDVPSVNTSQTVELSKVPRGQMLERIEASARKAASRLVQILTPELRRAGDSAPPTVAPFEGVKEWPWSWGEVYVPRPKLGANGDDLYSKKHDKRTAALRVLTSLALRESSPRQILEKCALDHFDTDTRRGCLEALRPLTIENAPTRRVVIEVFRREKDSRILNEAIEQMKYFDGPSREAAVQAWMEAASLGKGYGPLASLGDVPNLDLAIKRCLTARNSKKNDYERSAGTCLELLDPVPYRRRRALLWRFVSEMKPDSPYYLKGYGENEGSHGTPWGTAVKLLLEPAQVWDTAFEEVLWQRYQRTLSATALDVLANWAPPSKKGVDRLLEILKTTGNVRALRGLERMGEKDAAQAGRIKEALAELIAIGSFPKDVSKSDLERTIKEIERAEAKR